MSQNIIEALSIDCVIFGFRESELSVLLVRHGTGPTKGEWALPGSWICYNESLEKAANRILLSQTAVKDIFLEQFKTYGDVDRFPNKRVITIVYYALINSTQLEPTAGASMTQAQWFKVSERPRMPFDHETILKDCFQFLKHKVQHEPIGFNLLPPKFTLLELLSLYEAILETKLDKSNFRKKFLKMNLLVDTKETQKDVSHRAAKLYQFDVENYQLLCERGFNFGF